MERYRLIEHLGVGGMSVVWRAHDEVLGRAVAVKQLTTADDPRSRRRIQAEARAAALLSHPNIAAVYDFGHTADGVPFVVMELIEGESLETRLLRAGGPLPVAEALRIAGQLASALAAVHARGLVHHDVKPANVMLTAGGAKLVDFGVSAIAGHDTDQLLGTPAYLAPERIRGLPPSAATDTYALGLVLYRMLAGVLPWPATTTEEMLHAHRKLAPAPLPASLHLPDGVADALRRCLAKAPGNRPAAADLAARLTVPPTTGPGTTSRLAVLPAIRRITTARIAALPVTRRIGTRLESPAHRLRAVTLGGSVKRRASVAVAAVLLLGLGTAGAAAQDRDPVAAWTPASAPAGTATPQASDPATPATDPAAPTTGSTVPTTDPAVPTTAAVKKPGAAPPVVQGPGGPKKGKDKGKSKKSGG